MRTATCVVLVLVLACPTAPAAPARDTAATAKAKLEDLKQKVPDVLKQGAEEQSFPRKAELRRVRQFADREAKVTVFRRRAADVDLQPLTVYLRFHAGVWTATNFRGDWEPNQAEFWNRAAHVLMDYIDEAAEK
jgi:hypothetical protein